MTKPIRSPVAFMPVMAFWQLISIAKYSLIASGLILRVVGSVLLIEMVGVGGGGAAAQGRLVKVCLFWGVVTHPPVGLFRARSMMHAWMTVEMKRSFATNRHICLYRFRLSVACLICIALVRAACAYVYLMRTAEFSASMQTLVIMSLDSGVYF